MIDHFNSCAMKRHKTALLSTAISTTTTTTDTAAAPVHDAPLLCLGCERELNGQVYIEVRFVVFLVRHLTDSASAF